jgi:cytochrome c553
MNRAFSPFVKSLFVALLAVSAAASAVEANPAVAKADPVKGAALYVDGDAARCLPACVSCHGAAGNSTISINPKLAGQHEAYIHKQLVNFTAPERNQAIMTTFSKMLTDDEKKDISAYLAAQVPAPGAAKNKDTVEIGKKIYRAGILEKNVPACASCHGAAGAGIPAQYPRLAGQHQDYTASQLTMFRSGARNNNAAMTTIAKRMSDDEIKAVADYVAGLK